MRKFSFLLFLCCALSISAQQHVVIDLWPDGAPTPNGLSGEEQINKQGHISNVSHPTLTVYRAAKPNGQAVIMCPGGGYSILSSLSEGHNMAWWFIHQGITFAVLKYRLPNGHHKVPLEDALQAIRILRSHASDWNIKQIGIMGASAGGHLATSAAVLYTADSRPDFQVLFYPRISLSNESGMRSSTYKNLFGGHPTKELAEYYSANLHVNANTPPAFIMHSTDDGSVPVEESINYYLELRKNKVQATMHIYPVGGHGWGFDDRFSYKQQWTQELEKWLREIKP